MRRPLFALLLLGTAVPAIAADPEMEPDRQVERQDERREAREERRQERIEPRQPREEAPPRFERSEPPRRYAEAAPEAPPPPPPPPPPEQAVPRFERRVETPRVVANDGGPDQAPVRERRREWSRPDGGEERGDRARPADSVEGWRWRERQDQRRERRVESPPPPVIVQAPPPPGVAQPRDGDRSWAGRRDDRRYRDILGDQASAESWRRDWRRDGRYDWRRHRDRDRGRFHIGIYIDPFGWRYRPWEPGWRLPSRFYSSRYWINDPWYYRLPPVYGPYRWVRYYDDVLLVDLRTGRVVDRIPRFFW